MNFDLSPKKKKQIFCLFHAFNPFWEELYQNPVQFFFVIPRGIPLPHSNALQYYVKREKCRVNDIIFTSGFEARAINLDNKNMKIGIFTGGTSVRSKNVFIAISRYPTGKQPSYLVSEYSQIMIMAAIKSSISMIGFCMALSSWSFSMSIFWTTFFVSATIAMAL